MKKTYVTKNTFLTTTNLYMQGSWGVGKKEQNVEVSVTVNINGSKGSFEIYDTETSGDSWYASGGLWFKGNQLTGYDGVFSLSDLVIEELESRGYRIDL